MKDPSINIFEDTSEGSSVMVNELNNTSTKFLRMEFWTDMNVVAVGILSMRHYHCDTCWRCRLRFSWAALRGKLFTDDILLDKKSAHNLAAFIQASVPKP